MLYLRYMRTILQWKSLGEVCKGSLGGSLRRKSAGEVSGDVSGETLLELLEFTVEDEPIIHMIPNFYLNSF